jgi:hypothetical protein
MKSRNPARDRKRKDHPVNGRLITSFFPRKSTDGQTQTANDENDLDNVCLADLRPKAWMTKSQKAGQQLSVSDKAKSVQIRMGLSHETIDKAPTNQVEQQLTLTTQKASSLANPTVQENSAVLEDELTPQLRAAPNNIATRIMQQSTHGTRIPRDTLPFTKWNKSHVSFGSQQHHPFASISRLAWDPPGVLLAVASTGAAGGSCVRVYDWDSVRCADQAAKSQQARQSSNSSRQQPLEPNQGRIKVVVEPILCVPTTREAIVCMEWNPYNTDELAVGCVNGTLCLYDLGASAPTFRTYTIAKNRDCNMNVVFVDNGERIVAFSGETLACYLLTNPSKPVWTFTWRRMSAIVKLDSSFVLLGSTTGHFAVLDWKTLQRTSFSNKPSPVLVDEWLSCKGLQHPGNSWMGIRQISIDKNFTASTDCALSKSRGVFKLTWTTTCGWVLSMNFKVTKARKGTANLRFSTKPVRVVTAEGETVEQLSDASWSLPSEQCLACSSNEMIVWVKVPDARRILPHHDRRIMGETQPRLIQADAKPGLNLMWLDSKESKTRSITLSKRRGFPSALAIHPSNEWIVVGTTNSDFYVLGER